MAGNYENYFSDEPLHYFHNGTISNFPSRGVAKVIDDLPNEKKGVVLIASDELREAAKALGRTDVVSPGSTVDNPFSGRNETIYAVSGFKH